MPNKIKILQILIIVASCNVLFGQNYETHNAADDDFSVQGKYLNEIDSIKNNADQIVLQEEFLDRNGYEIMWAFSPLSNFVATKNALSDYSLNIKGLPFSKSAFYFNGVNISRNFYGNFNISALPKVMFGSVRYKSNSDEIYAGSGSLTSTIHAESIAAKEKGLEVNLHGGNYYGSGNIDYSGTSGHLYWSAAAAYKKSSGFAFAENYPSQYGNLDQELRNSDEENATLYLIGGIADDNSDVSFSILHIDMNMGVPRKVINPQEELYLRESISKLSLLNFSFKTKLNEQINSYGNFYYKQNRQVFDNYNDDEYNSQSADYAFHRTNDDNSFGGNIAINFGNGSVGKTELFINYSRDLYKLQPNFGLELQRTEAENFSLGIIQDLFQTEYFKSKLYAKYHIYNMLYTTENDVFFELNYPEAGASFVYLLGKQLVMNGGVNLGAKIPEQILLLDTSKNFKFSEKALNFDVGLSYKIGSTFRTGISMYLASLTDIVYHRELYLFPDEAHTYNDMNYGMNTFFEIRWKGFELYANYSNHNSDKAYYYYTPKHNAFVSFSKEYDFGLKWTFEANYSGERNSPNFSSETTADYLLFNSRIAQKIAQRFEIYVDLNNITNEYYEYIPGYPQPGFIFAAGIKILIGDKENE